MVSIFFNDYEVKVPAKHPGTGDIVLSFVEGENHYHFPMEVDAAEAYHEALGELLGKNGPKITPASMDEIRKMGKTR